MSALVNHSTGEIVDTIGADAARRLTTEARNEFTSAADHFERGWAKVEQAVQGGGHLDLGYRSAGDYLHAEFDGVLSGLDVTARRIAVKTMTSWGLSTRAIAPVVAASFKTVARDAASPVSGDTPEPVAVTEADDKAERLADDVPVAIQPEGGQELASAVRAHPSSPKGAADADAGTCGATPPYRPPVTGIDGKTYAAPKQQAPASRRRPLPDAFFDAAYDLTKITERINRLVEDDRFPQNAEKVGAKHRADLLRAVELLSKALDHFSN